MIPGLKDPHLQTLGTSPVQVIIFDMWRSHLTTLQDYSGLSPYPPGATTRSQRKPVQQVIPDDWDNDEDEEEDSAKVWEDA
jgi:predicted nicotinamide N-methyase